MVARKRDIDSPSSLLLCRTSPTISDFWEKKIKAWLAWIGGNCMFLFKIMVHDIYFNYIIANFNKKKFLLFLKSLSLGI